MCRVVVLVRKRALGDIVNFIAVYLACDFKPFGLIIVILFYIPVDAADEVTAVALIEFGIKRVIYAVFRFVKRLYIPAVNVDYVIYCVRFDYLFNLCFKGFFLVPGVVCYFGGRE